MKNLLKLAKILFIGILFKIGLLYADDNKPKENKKTKSCCITKEDKKECKKSDEKSCNKSKSPCCTSKSKIEDKSDSKLNNEEPKNKSNQD
jgi:hypothetical protein